ncbi:hypothetical protein EDL98_11735 [Ornithobacterium rhinotracheale]|uniref:hypothetical protein n=1 Tax=Ornithobacterium rhinotracheale TaxID=28251 RepID=UPI00129C653A|nr:hypothetical protein [Ornithobacterium rhinotracheale]MRJ11730.1 hypothetical protein [Ornithobacterium rhinotracheale]
MEEKVVLNLTPEKLNALLMALNEAPNVMSYTPAQRAVKSIIDELLTKLLKKQVEKRNDPPNKAFKLKLKHYEAFALSEMLARVGKLLPADFIFEKNAIRRIISQTNEQL